MKLFENEVIRVSIDSQNCVAIENLKSGKMLAIMPDDNDIVFGSTHKMRVSEIAFGTMRI